MKKTLLAGLATVLFFLTSTGIAMAGDDAKNKTDSNKSKATGLYDNVRILQEQINSLTERIGRIETLHGVEDRFTDMGDGTIRDNNSGLFWLKLANCIGQADWQNAKKAAAEMRNGMCGLQDGSEPGEWRLPTIAEWEAFMSNVYRDPALVNTVGDGHWSEGDAFYWVMSAYFWSRTEEDDGRAWFAYMGKGETYNDWKTSSMYIWPVRKHPRFTDMGDGTIRDNNSGLIWLKDASCGDLPHTDEYGQADWQNANVGAAELAWGTCGLQDGSEPGDWRLPTIAEWLSFMTPRYTDPALVDTRGSAQWSEGDAFTGVESESYWSSTTDDLVFEYAEAADLWVYKYHDSFPKTWSWFVWPVRNDN